VGDTISAVLLDLDETILYDDAATDTAMAATVGHAERLAGVDAACLDAAVRAEALALWQSGPYPGWCDDLGTSELEGLRSTFEGDDPRMVETRAWGPGFRRESWRRALRRCGIDDENLAAVLDERFGAERAATNPFIPGAEEALDRLAERFRLAIVTNGIIDVQREKLIRTGLLECFEVVVISGEIGRGKPHRSVYDETLRRLDLPPEACVMVGDNFLKDVAGAQALGIRGVWIAAARPVPAGDVEPFLVVDTLAELPDLLQGMCLRHAQPRR
jgi:putative hydrolase of the HAD superfamily